MAKIPTAGLARKAKRDSEVIPPLVYRAYGTGTGAEADGDTALGTEITTGGLGRKAATVTAAAAVTSWDDTTTATAAFTIAELGLFDANSGPTLGMRHKLAIAKTGEAGDAVALHCEETHSEVI
jgi:hypothetical protein